MELRHFRYFIAVAEELNFTRAAKRLGMKQPPLSTQIGHLETELGTKLFRRLSRGVELTPAGTLFLVEARAIVGQTDQAKRGLQSRARGESGELRIGFAGSSYFSTIILSIIRKFRAQHPGISLIPVQTNSAVLLAKVETGEIDAAFVRSLRTEAESGVSLERLFDEKFLAALPSDHRLANGRSITLSALAKENFLLFPRKLNMGMNDRIVAACRRAGFKPAIALEVSDAVSMIALVAAGFGVSLVPESVGQVRLDGVKYLAVSGESLSMPLNLAYRQDSTSPALAKFKIVARRLVPRAAQAREQN